MLIENEHDFIFDILNSQKICMQIQIDQGKLTDHSF